MQEKMDDRLSLSENEQVIESNLRHIYHNEWIRSRPGKKQLLFLMLPQTELLYGGAAGGGV